MSEFSERIGRYRSRLNLGAQQTQLSLASVVAVMILLVSSIALFGSDDETVERAGETTSQTSQEVEDRVVATDDATGSGPSSGVVSAPGASAGPSQSSLVPGSGDLGLGKQIKVGISYVTDPGAANAAAGFGGIGQIDQKRAWDAVIADINKDLPGGRKIVPVYFGVTTDDITSKGEERLAQEACAHYTQDNKVFAVWDGPVTGDTLHACLTKAKVPDLGGGGGLSYSKTYADFPYLVSPNDAAMDRLARFEVDKLYEAGFFSEFKDNAAPYTPRPPADGKPRIGLIRYDQPSFKAGAAAMKQRLKAHGLSLCSGCEFEVSYSSDNVQEQLDDATEVNAAIQNCKSRPGGACTHMLFLGSTAGVRITLFFVDGAEKQQYRPRLGLNPLDAPTAVTGFLGPPSYPQFRESVLVADGPREFDTRTEAFNRCKKLIEAAGETFSGDEAANKEAQSAEWCDTAWYFEAALKAAGPSLTLETYMNGVHSMDPVASASKYRMQTKKGRHDGSGAIRVGEWFDDCDCFKPTTDVQLV